MATTPDGTVIFGEGLTLMANAVEYEDEIPLAGIRTSLLCSQRVLQQPFFSSVRERMAAVAPANLLLRWLADIRSLRGRLFLSFPSSKKHQEEECRNVHFQVFFLPPHLHPAHLLLFGHFRSYSRSGFLEC
jgi:hypothetical protein